MTTVFFLRHGLTKENREKRVQGQQAGTLLLPETEHYLAAVVPLLREKKIDVLLSSDLERAIKTRHILYDFILQPNLREETTPLLTERAMGFYEGMLWSEVPSKFRQQRHKQAYDYRAFGGENAEDVRERVRAMLRLFSSHYTNQRVCAITHAGWLRQLVWLANSDGVLPDQWTDRSAIYEGGIGSQGQLKYFHPVGLEAEAPDKQTQQAKLA
jgi:broad specificity phosphatase PhoE